MSTYKSAVKYFKSLAIRNKAISHNDAERQRKFFRMDIDEFWMNSSQQLPAKEDGPFMILFNYKVGFSRIDFINKQKQFQFMILRNFEANNFADEEDAYDVCESVMEQILNKMNEENAISEFLRWSFDYKVDIDAVKYVISTGKYVGWQATFTLNERVPVCVNAEDWNEPQPEID